jgi:peptidoglycan/LPS O-acetylase OafA/YrhL
MRFRALDGIRGISSLCVMLFHIQVLSSGLLGHLPDRFVTNSYLFVDFFFVLSGFVIAAAYGDRLRSRRDLVIFGVRRFIRLWPLHVAMLLVLVLIELARLPFFSHVAANAVGMPFGPRERPSTILANLVLIQGLGVFSSTTWNVPSWSISVEFYCYAVFALSCLLVGWRKPVAWLILALGGAVVLIDRSGSFMDVSYDFGFLRCIFGFFTGALTFLLYRRVARAGVPPGLPIAEMLAAVAVLAFLGGVASGPTTYAAPLLFAIVIFVFAFEQGKLSVALNTAPMQWLGKISYSIYMVQWNVLTGFGLALHVLQRLHVVPAFDISLVQAPPFAGDAFVVAYMLMTCGIAALTWRYIEQPPQLWWARQSKQGWALPPVAIPRDEAVARNLGPPPPRPAKGHTPL